MTTLKAVCIGAGYFSQFQYEAWSRIPEVEILATCDRDESKAKSVVQKYGIPKYYTDYQTMFDQEKPDFVDVITPPESHLAICQVAGERGIHICCQKPLAPTLAEARQIVRNAANAGIRFMVHENFRFQPWHQEIKRLLDAGSIGTKLHSLNFRLRQGDGWGEKAYLGRQPYFRTMPRLLLHETGVHYIDTFRFLAGEITEVFAVIRRLNPVIKGEDCALLLFQFASGAVGVWDANRYNEANTDDPRFTFGEFLIEGDGGTIRLYLDGRITIQPLGEKEQAHPYSYEKKNFSGDCVYFTQRHFVNCMLTNQPFVTSGETYLKVVEIEAAFYQSATDNRPVTIEAS